MGALTDAERIYVTEEKYTFRSKYLNDVLTELDKRTSHADCFTTISRTSGLISKIEYFSDIARTNKVMERQYSRVIGYNGFSYVNGIVTIFYNDDASEDSRVTTTITRDSNANKSVINQCDNVFTTSEVGPC